MWVTADAPLRARTLGSLLLLLSVVGLWAAAAADAAENTQWLPRNEPAVVHGTEGDVPVQADYDGDGSAEIGVFRPSSGAWLVRGAETRWLGGSSDVPVPGDYLAGPAAEIAVWQPSSGAWHVPGQTTVFHGNSGDIPVPADYDGSGDVEQAVFRPSTGGWYIRGASTVYFGYSGDIPVPADYDGDGDAEIAVWRPSNGSWYVRGLMTRSFGLEGDRPVAGDWNGDGSAETAVWRPSNGGWYVYGQPTVYHGAEGDRPVPADYNGDGRLEMTVLRLPDQALSPAPPSQLRIASRTQTSLTLAWSASSSPLTAGYGIYRNGGPAGSTTQTSYTFTGLACGQSHTLGADTYDAFGNRSTTIELAATTSACTADTQPPSVPQGLHTSARTQTTITLAWNASSDNVGVTGYRLWRADTPVATTTQLSYTFTGLACGTTYNLSVQAYDAAGNSSYRPEAVATTATSPCSDTQAPTTPTNLAATQTTGTSITVGWSPSTDNTGVTGYGRYRGTTLVSSGTGTTYTFTGLTCGTSYQLGVDAYDAAGNRSGQAQVTASTGACGDSTAPSTPSGLSASGVSQSSITLNWSASTDNVGVTGYGRYRDGALVSSGTGTSYSFTGLTCGTSYLLGVDAYDAAGNRSGRAQVSASTTACAGTPIGSAHLWLDPNGGSCTRRTTPGAYVDGQACGSMQAAANAAASGDTINIVDGTYGGQTLSGTKALSFRGAGPGRPSFGQVVVAATTTTFTRLLVENRDKRPVPFCNSWTLDYTLMACGANLVFDDVIVDGMRQGSPSSNRRGGIGLIGNPTGFVFKNGEIRGVWDSKGFQGGATNMLFENNLWHDIRLTPAGGSADVHNECAYITAGNNQVWRGNRFLQCPVMAMFFANYSGGPAFSGVLIENNVFTHATNSGGGWHDGAAFVIPMGTSQNNQVNNWTVRFNTFEVAPNIARTASTADDNGSAQFYGNLGADPSCGLPEWTISYNVGAVCGRTGEISVPNATNSRSNPDQAPFYVNAPGNDFHLKTGTNAAVNIGAPTYPARDADNSARPFGPSADAGAYERRS